MNVRKLSVEPPQLPPCEMLIYEPLNVGWRLRTGKTLECGRRAKYDIDGVKMCRTHAAFHVLDQVAREQAGENQ